MRRRIQSDRRIQRFLQSFESLVLDYIEGTKAWEDWEKKNPNYTDNQEKEFDKECDMIRDEMAAILYKNNLI